MKKIAHVREMKTINALPIEVIKVIEDNVTILDKEYGENRDVNSGYGGYVLVIESENELEQLPNVDITDVTFEFVDRIPCEDGQIFVSALILLGSDFGLLLVMPLEIFRGIF